MSEHQGAVLALHTTEPAGSVAVGVGARIEALALAAGGRDAPVLVAAVLELLRRAAIGLEDVAALAVTTGPGSFTGIRVGLSTAQGLAAARGWPVYACDSLRAQAAAWGAEERGALAVVLDARRGEVYAGLYEIPRVGPPCVRLEPWCGSPADAAQRLSRAARGGLAIAGSGADLLAPHLGPEARILRGGPPVPVATALLGLVRSATLAVCLPEALEPTYLRKSDAEVRRDAQQRPGA